MEKKLNIWSTIKFGGAFAGLMIGSGFASGQESLQFFGGFGLWGLAGIAILFCLYQWIVPSIMGYGYDSRKNPKIGTYQYYLGKYLGLFMDYFVPVFLLGVITVMCSGAGAIFEDFYGFKGFIGVALLVAAVLITYLLGLQKLVDIVGTAGSIIVFLMIATCIYGIFAGNDLSNANELVKEYSIPKGASFWWLAPFISISYAISTSVPFINAVGASATSRREAVVGGRIGAMLMAVLEFVLVAALLSNLTEVHDSSMPSLTIAFSANPILGHVYAIVILIGLYSTAAPMMWMICDKVPTKTKPQNAIVAIIIAVIVLIGGQLPFATLVNIIYPFTGYVGLIFLAGLLIRQIYNKRNRTLGEKNTNPLSK